MKGMTMTPREMELAFNRLSAELDDCVQEAAAAKDVELYQELRRAFIRLCKVQATMEKILH